MNIGDELAVMDIIREYDMGNLKPNWVFVLTYKGEKE